VRRCCLNYAHPCGADGVADALERVHHETPETGGVDPGGGKGAAVRRCGAAAVCERHPQRVGAGELHGERHPLRGHDRRVDHAGDGHRIVDGRMREALRFEIATAEEVEQFHDEPGGRGPHGRDPFDHVRGGERLVRGVEPHHDDGPSGGEHDVRGLRVDEDVELGRRGPVAAGGPPAHQHDLVHPVDDVGGETDREREVRQRSGCDEGDFAGGVGADRVDDDVHAVPRVCDQARCREHGTVEPGLAVGLDGRLRRAHERPVAARRDRHIPEPCDGRDGQRVAGDLLEGLVAGDGRHRDQIDIGVACGEEERDGIVVAGVAVEEDGGGHLGSLRTVRRSVGVSLRARAPHGLRRCGARRTSGLRRRKGPAMPWRRAAR